MRDLKWGEALLKCRPPECAVGRRILAAVEAGRTFADLSGILGASDGMVRYYVFRLVERDKAMVVLDRALIALEGNMTLALVALTSLQFETVRIMLAGTTERDAAKMSGVTQTAIASRVAKARRNLQLSFGISQPKWVKKVLGGLKAIGKARNLTSFQFKGGCCERS